MPLAAQQASTTATAVRCIPHLPPPSLVWIAFRRAKSEAGSASAAAAQASLSVPEHARTELESLRARVAQLETDLEDS